MGRGGRDGVREGEREGERIEQYTPHAAGISCKLCTVIRPGTEIFNDAYTCTCTWQVKMRKLLLLITCPNAKPIYSITFPHSTTMKFV